MKAGALQLPFSDAPAARAAEHSDEALMSRFIDGDSRAFEALFQRYARPVNTYLLRLVGHAATAEDLTQTTFLSMVRGRGRFQRGNPFKPWLYAIATNAARDLVRRRRPEDLTERGELPSDLAADPTPEPDAGLDRAVREALDALPEKQRIPILLHRFEGMSFAEVAEVLGTTEGAVKVRAHRGYERLRTTLRGLWEEL